MPQRLRQLEHWLAHDCRLADFAIEPASADASFRRYFRVGHDGTSYIVMDAPPAQEDCRPFIQVAGYLESMQLHAPRVLEANLEDGFLLLTDLGSKNGTNVNNRRIDGAQRLLSGDVIGIAATTMFYRWLPVEPTRTRESH